jgi:hypothetical protein
VALAGGFEVATGGSALTRTPNVDLGSSQKA